MTTVTFTSSGSWTAPAGVTSVDCQCWGEGGDGGVAVNGSHSGGGGGGGEFAEETALAVTPGTVYSFTIGSGGSGTDTSFPGDSVTVTAHHGHNASGQSQGAGGSASTNTAHHNGGAGANGTAGTNKGGAGGGSSAGTSLAGVNGSPSSSTVGGAGATAPSGGGNGGDGGNSTVNGSDGSAPGGGAGGGGDNGSHSGGTGAAGQVTLTYTAPVSGTAALAGVGTLTAEGDIGGTATLSGAGTLTAARAGSGNATLAGAGSLTANATQQATATLSGVGTLSASGGLPTPAAVNQWAGTFSQPAVFGTTPPGLQSLVVGLDPSTSVGGGSGTPTAGNWLFCLSGWNQNGLSASTVGVGDDIHSFWRPGDETSNTWAVSASAGKTRASIWYTPNLARTAGDVYVAPNGVQAGQACLVVEISGLGNWDTVTHLATNYSAAATTLNLALAAPSQAAFTIACVCGDSTASGQAFAPATWTALSTVTASNGVDHTCDAELTSAFLPSTAGSISVNGTASSATDLSGVILQVLVNGPSPIPASQNPNWPYLKFEAALGAGFQTPLDQVTWTDLSTRAWSWNETTGIQYQLGQIQATDLDLELDNVDGYLSSDNPSSPYFGSLVTGTPMRIRAALGTMGGTTINRWYVIQRNMQEWPQQIDDNYRRYVPGTGTDIWSTLAASGPTPYRGEVLQESSLYGWWPMDDQPGTAGVQPTSLRNAAPGNANSLSITASAAGVSAGNAYSTDGADLTATGTSSTTPPLPSVAVYTTGANAGWMYGDPQSSPASAQTGNPVTASPGSASWQQSGLAGAGGSNTWFLNVNDASFPGLSGGVTFSLWFNAAFFGTSSGYTAPSNVKYDVAGQPYSVITLATLATASAPVAVLQLDLSGHLNLITYNGTTAASHSIYSSSDLRSSSWHQVTVTLTTTTWAVYVNGGLTATVSGSAAGMTSAWTWLVINGDMGTAGGSSLSSIQHGGNAAYSSAEVYSSQLPAWRILAHYCAAVTAFGLLPAPQAVSLAKVANKLAGQGYVPDGSEFQGSYGIPAPSTVGSYTFSALAVNQAGTYMSGPSARTTQAGYGTDNGGVFYGDCVWVSFTGLAPSTVIYTGSAAAAETSAGTVCGGSSGDSFTTGYGASASGHGVSQTAGGAGANPPSSASALGDDVAQRIERALGYGGITYPQRSIDPAALAVQAATDIGGQQVGANVQNIAQSDGGMLFIDNLGSLTYWQKSHLASQYSSPVWSVGPSATGGTIPYYKERFSWVEDPQRVFNAITIQPFSPDGASLPLIEPANASSVTSSQHQYGAQPRSVVSYLQSSAGQQSQADWLLSNFGQVHIRVDNVKIDAAPYPAAWQLVLGVNVGDIVTCQNWQIGGGGITGTFRVTEIKRHLSFGTRNSEPEASVVLTLDFEPSSWWS